MKTNYFNWFIATAAGAIVGTIAVEAFKKHRARMADEKARKAVPNEILIIDKL